MDAGARISCTRLISSLRFPPQWSHLARRAVIVFLHVVLVVEGDGVVIAKRLFRYLISIREGGDRLGKTHIVWWRRRGPAAPPAHRGALLESLFHAAEQRGSVDGKRFGLVLATVGPGGIFGGLLEERSARAAVEVMERAR